jgi:hypothetical protein
MFIKPKTQLELGYEAGLKGEGIFKSSNCAWQKGYQMGRSFKLNNYR